MSFSSSAALRAETTDSKFCTFDSKTCLAAPNPEISSSALFFSKVRVATCSSNSARFCSELTTPDSSALKEASCTFALDTRRSRTSISPFFSARAFFTSQSVSCVSFREVSESVNLRSLSLSKPACSAKRSSVSVNLRLTSSKALSECSEFSRFSILRLSSSSPVDPENSGLSSTKELSSSLIDAN